MRRCRWGSLGSRGIEFFFWTVGYAQPGLFKALMNAWFRPAGRLAFSSLCRVLNLVARAAPAAGQPGTAALLDKVARMARGGGFRDFGHSLVGRTTGRLPCLVQPQRCRPRPNFYEPALRTSDWLLPDPERVIHEDCSSVSRLASLFGSSGEPIMSSIRLTVLATGLESAWAVRLIRLGRRWRFIQTLNPTCTQRYLPPAAVSPRSARCPYRCHHHRSPE